MNAADGDLGMDRAISRRDFLNGVAVGVGGAAVAPSLLHARAVGQAGTAPEQAQ